jgi:hypothetical protein
MALAIWANAPDVPGAVCADARLRGRNGGPAYPAGETYGQGGWDMGIQFSSLADLARKLFGSPVNTPSHLCGNWVRDCAPIRRGQVTRLAINAHGLAGQVFVNGRSGPALTSESVSASHGDLHNIGLSTSESAVILLMGCLAGQGAEGTRLLQALSRVWPGRTVVGFATIGYAPGGAMKRPGDPCTEPGMRDTSNTSGSLSSAVEDRAYGGIWNDLGRLPWASEVSPHAKVVQNGAVILGAQL